MGRHKSFPGPGDRIRLAVPLPTDEAGPHPRYGTVLERSCGRSHALRVRWDHEGDRSGYAPDAGTEGWLSDAGWYWDREHLQVLDHADVAAPAAVPVAEPPGPPAIDGDTWLVDPPRPDAGSPGVGVNPSMDAVTEWEAALASEIDTGSHGSWEQLLADAMASSGDRGRPEIEPELEPHVEVERTSGAARARGWTGDDILPGRPSGGRRWGRR